MTIALAKDVEDFLREQVEQGICADAGELVNDVIRSLRGATAQPVRSHAGIGSLVAPGRRPTDHAPHPRRFHCHPGAGSWSAGSMSVRKTEEFLLDVERQFEWYGRNATWNVTQR
jgi:Arc/MetJ-type ribon-helix-helix transcriptional regulator